MEILQRFKEYVSMVTDALFNVVDCSNSKNSYHDSKNISNSIAYAELMSTRKCLARNDHRLDFRLRSFCTGWFGGRWGDFK